LAQLVEEHPEDAHKVAEYATQIIATVRRASGLTKQLLAFSRKQIQNLRVLDLNALVNEFSADSFSVALSNCLDGSSEVVFQEMA
jgi:nitrogen fixation/metabolism regulation signal transduction histidine kinase